MLILTRKIHESIIIDDRKFTIKVIAIKSLPQRVTLEIQNENTTSTKLLGMGEILELSPDIKILPLWIDRKGRTTKIGIDAPIKTLVNREEIYERILAAKQEAALGQKKD